MTMTRHVRVPSVRIHCDTAQDFSTKKARLSVRSSKSGDENSLRWPKTPADVSDVEDEVFTQLRSNLFPRVKGSLKRHFPGEDVDWVTGISPPSPSQVWHEAVCLESPVRKKLQSLGVRKCQEISKKILTLGRGAYGTVVLGKYQGSKVAIKILDHNSLGNELHAAELDHENIVKILKVFPAEDGENFSLLVMECIGHYNLKDVIQNQSSKLTGAFIHRASTQLANALAYCHENGIVHLDVKPANVLVLRSASASSVAFKLADFGFSMRLNDTDWPPNVGTPGYQAPEILQQRSRARLTTKSDVYSYGVVLWQLAFKQPEVYPNVHPHTIIFQVATNPNYNPEVVSNCFSEDVPSYLRKLYKACWSNDVNARPEMSQIIKTLKLVSSEAFKSDLSTRSCGKRRRSSLRL